MAFQTFRDHAEYKRHEDAFNLNLGRSFNNWSKIEWALRWWFEVLSGLDRNMSTAIFYAARTFSGKIDLIEASLDACVANKNISEFVELAIKRCVAYSSFRNHLAHGGITIHGNENGQDTLIVDRRKIGPVDFTKGISVEDLEIAAANFDLLAGHLNDACSSFIVEGGRVRVPLEESLQRVRALPTRANSVKAVQS